MTVLGLLVLTTRLAFALQATGAGDRIGSIPTAAGAAVVDRVVLDRVVRDLCGKRVAVLGESPMHGFGLVLDFKVSLVRRLVDECGFNGVLFESGAYDFLEIQKELKADQPITPARISAAIGGVWAYQEVEPLIPFLAARVQHGTVLLGGLDDQLGRGTYAQQRMAADLTAHLQPEDRTRCLGILQRHTLWQYTDDAPYDRGSRTMIFGCLDAIAKRLSVSSGEYERPMIDNLRRALARDFRDDAAGADLAARNFNDRDQSMATNFQWFTSRLPANGKTIVWTANIHGAKNLSGVSGRERLVPLGSYISRQFKRDAFFVAFSSVSGSYAMGRQPARPLTPAPGGSLEAAAFESAGTDARYVDADGLRRFGSLSARLLGTDFALANWSEVFDGLVVFREERPPRPVSP